MFNNTSTLSWIKQNPVLPALVTLAAVLTQAHTHAQTFTWTNDDTNNVWTNGDNWIGGVAPSETTHIAVFSGGGKDGDTIFLRPSGSPGTNNIGTILLQNNAYERLFAGTDAATINFASAARIVYEGNSFPAPAFQFGDIDSNGTPRVNAVVPGRLDIDVAPFKPFEFSPRVEGAGSITLSRLAETTGTATIFIGDDYATFPSTFTGGVTVNSDVVLRFSAGSTVSGSTIANGPIGKGTLTLNGGTLQFGAYPTDTTLHNNIMLTANSYLETFNNASDIRKFRGAVTFSGHRLEVFPNFSPTMFDDATFSPSDTGTLSIRSVNPMVPGTVIFNVTGTSSSTFGAALVLDGNEAVKSGAGTLAFNGAKFSGSDAGTFSVTGGTLRFDVGSSQSGTFGPVLIVGGNNVIKSGAGTMTFDGTKFFGSDSGTFAVAAGTVAFNVGSASSGTWGGYVGVGTSGTLTGAAVKTGAGAFAAGHFRVGTLAIDAGTLAVLQEGTNVFGGGADMHVSRVETLTITGGATPTASLDLSNNELIIDYTGTSPLNGGTNSVLFGQINSAYNGGSWNGTGITSAHANAGTFAVGYGEATTALGFSSGTTTWNGQTVDTTSVLARLTYYGDATLDGITDIADFSRLAANWNMAGLWTEGDSDYDGQVTIVDFGQMAANFGATVVARGGLPPLAELYVALLDHPQIYWEARLEPSIWWRFEPIEALNLGAIPAVPASLLARGVPEPGFISLATFAALVMMRRARAAAVTRRSSRPGPAAGRGCS